MYSQAKFQRGNIVMVRSDLTIGRVYTNENDVTKHNKFSDSMAEKKGQSAKIIAVIGDRYLLSIDPDNLYVDTMLILDTGESDRSPYEYSPEVEEILDDIALDQAGRALDEALSQRMFVNDKEGFDNILAAYDYYSEVRKSRKKHHKSTGLVQENPRQKH